jgi:hypothetical protein
MYQFSRNIRIDGTAFGEDRTANARFTPSMPGLWHPGAVGISPSATRFSDRPQQEDSSQQKVGRGYVGTTETAWEEPEPSLDEKRKQAEEAEARRYEGDVSATLNDIGKTSSGRAVLAEVGRQSHGLTITPYLPSDRDWTNGKTIADRKSSARKHWVIRHCQDNKEKGWVQGDPVLDKNGRRTRGTGVGSDVQIEFITPDLARLVNSNPAIAVKSKWTAENEQYSVAAADEILVHELIHAIRDMAGLSVCRRVPRQPHYGTIEEFFAIVVTNVYRSESGRHGVRNSNHGKFEAMYCSGEQFLKLEFNRRHLRQLRRQHPLLVADLRRIEVYFNPFRHMAAMAA